jgi:aminopeptidase
MTEDGKLDAYARLAIEVGVNLVPGQDLQITGMLEHSPLVRAIANAAYAAGAR